MRRFVVSVLGVMKRPLGVIVAVSEASGRLGSHVVMRGVHGPISFRIERNSGTCLMSYVASRQDRTLLHGGVSYAYVHAAVTRARAG